MLFLINLGYFGYSVVTLLTLSIVKRLKNLKNINKKNHNFTCYKKSVKFLKYLSFSNFFFNMSPPSFAILGAYTLTRALQSSHFRIQGGWCESEEGKDDKNPCV